MPNRESLNKITIGNIRRFKKNVEIEIGQGATVFLATNGTGKTAIYEAIELALTGEVSRLTKPPVSLIRDLQDELSIRLDFNSGKFCEVNFNKDGNPVLRGNQRDLFGAAEAKDLPFLLRLTHILPQQTANWLVQAKSDQAADQLDRLAIGRDAIQVNGLMKSAKRAANAMLETADRELSDVQESLQSWKDLLIKRGRGDADLIASLMPLETLSSQIDQLALDVKIEGHGGDLPFIKSRLNACLSGIRQALETSRNEWEALSTLNSMLEELPGIITDLSDETNKLTVISDSKKEIGVEIASVQSTIKSLENDRSELAAGLKIDQELKRTLELLRENREQRALLAGGLPELRVNLADAEFRLTELKNNIEQSLILVNQHAEFTKRSHTIAVQQNEILELTSQLKRWEEIEEWLKEMKDVIKPGLLTAEQESANRLDKCKVQLDTLTVQLQEAHRNFDALNMASGAIREAVGTIVSNFPASRGDCPVCMSEFSPEVLRFRMEQALELINPELPVAAKRLEEAKVQTAQANQDLMVADSEHQTTMEKLSNLNDQIQAREVELIQIIGRFPESGDSKNAREFINKLSRDNDSGRTTLQLLRLQILPEPSGEQIVSIRLEVGRIEKEVLTINDRIRQNEKILGDLEGIIEMLEKENREGVGLGELNDRIVRKELSVATAEASLESVRANLSQQQANVGNLNNSLAIVENRISTLKSRMTEFQAKWSGWRLPGEPSEEELKSAQLRVQQQLSDFESRETKSHSIELELARWDAAELFILADKEIKQGRGAISEKDYERQLVGAVEEKTREAAQLQLKIGTLNSFSNHLEEELETVNERIRAINPLWNKLLKRVVIEPRFAATSLNSYSYHRKQHADVHVPLHNGMTLASHVASEAQITDLQLTFLLAMAQKYQWSSWPVLLLDDPTQHHDLVHASSVFDLLRDYISEYGFQVILATHDAVQARFFMHKLENDGIPARLWTLSAAGGGVTAVRK